MCGIIGYNGNLDHNNFLNGLKSLRYRGPDETGNYVNKDKNLALGINRLAISDVGYGQQPMESHRSVAVYNGEIYNNKELRDELIQLDCKFKTKNSDTETLLNLYEFYNHKMVNKINGMWSFCIYDKIKNPQTDKYVSIYGYIGKNVLNNYLNFMYRGSDSSLIITQLLFNLIDFHIYKIYINLLKSIIYK